MSTLANIRNIGIIAHIDAGKTTTTEQMLFLSGTTHRLGEVDDGSTVMDYLDEERQRGITIVSAAASFPWRDALLHLIDTPGHIDFTAEVERSLRVIDGAVVIFSGVEGVEAQSEKVWLQADAYHLPRIALVNKLDRIGADFDRVFDEINAKFADRAVAVHCPVGIESDFEGVIDLMTMKMLRFSNDGVTAVSVCDIPEAYRAGAEKKRIEMIEKLADSSDDFAELYLQSADIAAEEMRRLVRLLVLGNAVVPVLAGSAKKSIGVQTLLDAVVDFLPSPADITDVDAYNAKSNEPTNVSPDPANPFAGLIFKVIAGQSADLYYLRTYAGTLKSDSTLYVPRTGEKARIKRILRLYAKNTEVIDSVGPGEIVGIIGPKDIYTGDTLCDRHGAVVFERMAFPEPVISIAIEPRSNKDKKRVREVLSMLCREDPTLAASEDENTGQNILSGMGELHLDINIKRIQDEFNTAVQSGEPRVAFRETIRGHVSESATFNRVIADNELFAKVTIALRPLTEGDDLFVVEDRTDSRNPEHPLRQAALDALRDGIKTGGNNGYPLIYVAGDLIDLETHPQKTTEAAVLGAVLAAMDQAIKTAGTVILQPVMHLEILAPEDTLGDLSNNLQSRKAVIHSVSDVSERKRVTCEVPLSEMFGFSKALPKLTGGRGSFSMEPCGYREL